MAAAAAAATIAAVAAEALHLPREDNIFTVLFMVEAFAYIWYTSYVIITN